MRASKKATVALDSRGQRQRPRLSPVAETKHRRSSGAVPSSVVFAGSAGGLPGETLSLLASLSFLDIIHSPGSVSVYLRYFDEQQLFGDPDESHLDSPLVSRFFQGVDV